MIADIAALGYIHGTVLDTTYGKGVFWKVYRPDGLWKGEEDFTAMSWGDGAFDTVVFDPPYKLNGTPSKPDERYGVDVKATTEERMKLCFDGGAECIRVLKIGGHLIWKCMDQVVSGAIVWQTARFTRFAEWNGCDLVDRFDFLHEPRKQPAGRRQVHAARCYSTALILEKVR